MMGNFLWIRKVMMALSKIRADNENVNVIAIRNADGIERISYQSAERGPL